MINAVQIVDAWKEFFNHPTGALCTLLGLSVPCHLHQSSTIDWAEDGQFSLEVGVSIAKAFVKRF